MYLGGVARRRERSRGRVVARNVVGHMAEFLLQQLTDGRILHDLVHAQRQLPGEGSAGEEAAVRGAGVLEAVGGGGEG